MYPESQPGLNHAMIVMEFVQGVDLESKSSRLPHSVFDDIETAVDLLHTRDFVFGDLREPNVMAMLVDFDWCGKHLEGRYPLRMNLELGWHTAVGPGAVMDKEHDTHMLNRLRSRGTR
ncbi:hypothetical protein B0J17DRAFT_666928 [Rhizoctonia solani]|nr:hypothetical protein B0J17DRAFT_666928 [Rhizoctonia solani]